MADKNKIKVAVRVRPFNRRGKKKNYIFFIFLVLSFYTILLYLKKNMRVSHWKLK